MVELPDGFVFKKTDTHQPSPLETMNSSSVLNNSDINDREKIDKQDYLNVANDYQAEMISAETESFQRAEFIKETDNRNHFNKALELMRFNKQTEALKVVEFIEAQFPESKKINTLKARILYELKQIKEAKSICLGLIEKDQWYVWPYIYLGLFALNDHEELVKQLKKAIYVRPTCWLAHYYLAKHYFSTSSIKAAAREMRNVIRLAEKNKLELDETELFLEPVTIEKALLEFKEKLSQIESKPA